MSATRAPAPEADAVVPPERVTAPVPAGAIPASRCPRCGRTCAPPARYCPDDGAVMSPATVPANGAVISFTTLYSPPTGFASPLHLALVELSGGAKFFCHGAGTKGLRLGSPVTIEAVNDIYYFSTLSLAGRAALFWRRRTETATGRLSSFAKSAAQRLLRRTP